METNKIDEMVPIQTSLFDSFDTTKQTTSQEESNTTDNIVTQYVGENQTQPTENQAETAAQFIAKAATRINETDYWQKRGLTIETIKHFNFGFVPKFKNYNKPALIIPTGDGINHYVARLIGVEGKNKVIASTGKRQLFNLAALNQDIVICVEGEIDAASLWQVGIEAVGLGGTGNFNRLISVVNTLPNKPKCILLPLDNDEAGKECAEKIKQKLNAISIPSIVCIDIYGKYKDANEFLCKDATKLKTTFQTAIYNANKLVNQNLLSINHSAEPETPKKTQTQSNYPADSPEFLETKINEAIKHIDCKSLSRDQWRNVGMALKSVDEKYLPLWIKFSKTDPTRYHEGECEKQWQSFKGEGITISTFFEMAKNGGYDEGNFWHEWHNTHTKSNDLPCASLYDSAQIKPDNEIIQLLKAKKFIEARTLAYETINAFMAKEEVNLDDVYNENLLYAIGYFVANAFVAIEHQSITKKLREKCKKVAGVSVSGEGGLDETIKYYADKIQKIGDEQAAQVAQKRKQEYIDELNQQQQLAEQKKIPLPFNKIVLPKGCYMNIEKQCTNAFDINGLPITSFESIQLITKILKNIDTGIEKLEVATLKKNATEWTFTTATRDFFADNRKIVGLSANGLDVMTRTAPTLVEYHHEFEILNYSIIPKIKQVNKTGWRGNDFIYPNHSDCKYQLDDSMIAAANKVYSKAGEMQPTIDILKKVKKHDVANISIGGVLATPLIKLFNIENIALHLYAPCGSGKSLIMKLAASIYANPNEPLTISPADATRAGLENYFALHYDLPSFIDDIENIEEKRREVILLLPYQFVNGKGRMRAKAKGGNDILIDFSGGIFTNGERPLTNLNSKGGLKRRCVEIEGEEHIFDIELAIKIDEVTKANYGHVGRQWILYIQEHKDKMISDFKFLAYGDDENPGLHKTFAGKAPLQINAICAITIANIHFDIHFLGMNEDEAKKIEMDCALRILQALPNQTEIADWQRAKDYIIDWINSNQKSFATSTNDIDFQEGVSYKTFGVIRKNDICIIPTILQQYLKDNNFSPEMVLKQLADEGFIIRGDKTTKLVKINGTPKRFYVFSKNKLYPNDTNDKDNIL